MFEQLEARRLMSATFDAASHVLKVEGGNGPDVVSVRQEGDRFVVTENGREQSVDAPGAVRVEVHGGRGRDRIVVAAVGVNLSVVGGDGTDHISADDVGGACTLLGDGGNDVILGSTGDDRVIGGDGNDRVMGRGGRDELRGGLGKDLLDGGDGDDSVWGEAGNDRLRGGPGEDRLNDTVGRNRFSGGEGRDTATVPDGRQPPPRDVEASGHFPVVDPAVFAYVTRSADGAVAVVVDASHPEGGYRRTFSDVTPEPGGRFSAQVMGEDLAGPEGGRTHAVEVDRRTYDLGRLAPGTYEFVVHAAGRVLKTVPIGVTADGLTPDTPTGPGPFQIPPPAEEPTPIELPHVETDGRYPIADPIIHAWATRSGDGVVSVVVDASHPAGGFRRTFHDMTAQPGGRYLALVIGEDLAGPNDGRTQAFVVERRTYELGRLAPGTYEFVVHGPHRVLKTVRIGVTADGLTADTPTSPGPGHIPPPWVDPPPVTAT